MHPLPRIAAVTAAAATVLALGAGTAPAAAAAPRPAASPAALPGHDAVREVTVVDGDSLWDWLFALYVRLDERSARSEARATERASERPTAQRPAAERSSDRTGPAGSGQPTATRTEPRTAEPAPRTSTAPPPAPSGGTADRSEAAAVLGLVNTERGRAGCPAVSLDDRLTTAATRHSQDMADRGYFDHTGLDGRSFVDRARAAGYTAPRSENIAAGQQTPADVVHSWMTSDGHRRNILDCSATEMGLGVGRGGPYGIYWTQMFGTG